MKIRRYVIPICLIFLGIFINSCSSNPTKGQTKFSVRATQLSPNVKVSALNNRSLTIGDTGVTIETALLNVEKVKFKLPDELTCTEATMLKLDGNQTCEKDDDIEKNDGTDDSAVIMRHDGECGPINEEMEDVISVQGPFIFDLMTGTSTPEIPSLTVPPGLYRKVKLTLAPSMASGDLQNLTFLGKGTFADANGASHNFRLALAFFAKLKIENDTGVQIGSNVANSIVASLNFENILKDAPLRACVASGELPLDANGDLVITNNTVATGACSCIAKRIVDNLQDSFELESGKEDKD